MFTATLKTHSTTDLTAQFPTLHRCRQHGTTPQILHIVAGRRKEDHYVATCQSDDCSKISMASAEDVVAAWNKWNPES